MIIFLITQHLEFDQWSPNVYCCFTALVDSHLWLEIRNIEFWFYSSIFIYIKSHQISHSLSFSMSDIIGNSRFTFEWLRDVLRQRFACINLQLNDFVCDQLTGVNGFSSQIVRVRYKITDDTTIGNATLSKSVIVKV